MPLESAASADLNKLRIDRPDRRDVSRRRRSPWPWIFLILILAGGGGFYWYWKNELSIPAVTTARVVLVTPNESNAVLTASGYVVAQRKAILGAKSPRRLVERFANEGEHVSPGQIVARLDHADVDARLEQAKAGIKAAEAAVLSSEAMASRAKMAILKAEQELAEAKSRVVEATARRDGDEREVKRYQAAEKAGASVRKDRELAETQLAVSTAGLETAKQQIKTSQANIEWMKKDFAASEADVNAKKMDLISKSAEVQVADSLVEDTIIRAPFAGIILLKQAEVGEAVSPGVVSGQVTSGSIFQIADFDTLEAEVDINESNVSKVADRQPCEIAVDAIPTKTFRGELRLLMPGANRQKGTVAAKVIFLDRDSQLRPDLGCKVTFLREAAATQAAPKLLAPRNAFRKVGNQTIAYLYKDGRANRRAVEIADAAGDRVEVKSGLREGDEIIVSPGADLADGAPVRIPKQ